MTTGLQHMTTLARRVASCDDLLAKFVSAGQYGACLGMFAHTWSSLGMPVLRLQPRVIAALAATAPSPTKLPWPAFILQVPPGLIEDTECHVAVMDNDRTGYMLVAHLPPGEQPGVWSAWKTWERAIVEFEGKDAWAAYEPGPTQRDTRTLRVLFSMVLGASALASQHRPTRAALGAVERHLRSKRGVRGEQFPCEYVVGRDVVIDLSSRIREYVDGSVRSTGMIQWLVRGHWRNQACGHGLSDRRMTWIEPHWKGDPDAAVLVRNHVLEGDE